MAARYYLERTEDGRIARVVLQDARGIYIGRVHDGAVNLTLYDPAREVTIQSRETGAIIRIANTAREYLEHMRRYYRHPAYFGTTAEEIQESPGSVEEVMRHVLAAQQ